MKTNRIPPVYGYTATGLKTIGSVSVSEGASYMQEHTHRFDVVFIRVDKISPSS